MDRRSLPALVVAAVLALVGLGTAAGCADDGRELAQPQSWQTTTTRPPPPTSAPDQEASASGVELTSPVFEPGGDIPVSATCAGDNVFPELQWTSVPAETAELAVTLSDQTDPDEPLLLWLMAGIDPALTRLPSGTLPAGAFETLNDFGNPGYGTPCLENLTNGRRDLQFRLYILDQTSGIQPGDPGNDSWDTLRSSAVESASLLAQIDARG